MRRVGIGSGCHEVELLVLALRDDIIVGLFLDTGHAKHNP